MLYVFSHNGSDLSTAVSSKPGAPAWVVQTPDSSFDLTLALTPDGRTIATVENDTWTVEATPADGGLLVQYNNTDYLLHKSDQVYTGVAGGQAAGPGAETEITAHLPGGVAQVRVKEGDEVSARQTLVVLEAMKMEHHITAPYDGVVTRVSCEAGMQVMKGASLLDLEPAGASAS